MIKVKRSNVLEEPIVSGSIHRGEWTVFSVKMLKADVAVKRRLVERGRVRAGK